VPDRRLSGPDVDAAATRAVAAIERADRHGQPSVGGAMLARTRGDGVGSLGRYFEFGRQA